MRLIDWSIRRSGDGMRIDGKDVATGTTTKLTGIVGIYIRSRHGLPEIVVSHRDGTRHELALEGDAR